MGFKSLFVLKSTERSFVLFHFSVTELQAVAVLNLEGFVSFLLVV